MTPFPNPPTLGLFVYSLVSVFVMVLGWSMVSQARRKRLTALLPWLVPAAAAVTVSVAASLLRDVVFLLVRTLFGVSAFGPSAWPFLRLAELLLGTLSALLTVVAALRLWRMVADLPADPGPAAPPAAQADVWPPPPTGRA